MLLAYFKKSYVGDLVFTIRQLIVTDECETAVYSRICMITFLENPDTLHSFKIGQYTMYLFLSQEIRMKTHVLQYNEAPIGG